MSQVLTKLVLEGHQTNSSTPFRGIFTLVQVSKILDAHNFVIDITIEKPMVLKLYFFIIHVLFLQKDWGLKW